MSSYSGASDFVRVNDLALSVSFSDGSRWPSATPHEQPVLVSFSLGHDVRNAAATDDLSHSVNYSTLAMGMKAIVDSDIFPSIEAFVDRVCFVYSQQYPQVLSFSLRVVRTKALLYGTSFGVEVFKVGNRGDLAKETFFFQDILAYALIGIHPHERQRKQRVRFNVMITRRMTREQPLGFRILEQRIFDFVDNSKCLTVEALASEVARVVLFFLGDQNAAVVVRVSKPSAILDADSAEVEVTRTLTDYRSGPNVPLSSTTQTSNALLPSTPSAPNSSPVPRALPHRVAIAIGSNIGDRFANIERSLRLLELSSHSAQQRVIVVDTSFMYETAPMYVVDQPMFINCACMIETDLEPRELLSCLKQIEETVGRTESVRNGPRAIDLDIVTYDDVVLDTRAEGARTNLDNLHGELVIPHPRVLEREFVLRPLADMIPDHTIPGTKKTVEKLLAEVTQSGAMYKVVPFPQYPLPHVETPRDVNLPPVPPTAAYWTYSITPNDKRPAHHTYIMATLNATPDSFSDGSVHYALPDALSYAAAAVAAGANIIDIGGYSTRPGAAYVSPEDEFSRVVPVIQAIRDGGGVPTPTLSGQPSLMAKISKTLISVDTFRWEVAEEAVHAGANCINDVYAFEGVEYPPNAASEAHFAKMRQVARDLAVPVVLMHSRGLAAENKDYTAYAYAKDPVSGRGAVVEGVRVELGAKVERAVKGPGGIRRWLVIVDPGVGFSKTVEGNLELLREAASVVAEYAPRLRNESLDGAPVDRPARNPLAGYPMLIGTSRKSFLGTLLQQPDAASAGCYEGRETRPDERDFATAAAVSCAVQQGATVVRVHDVLGLGDVVRVASALWP